MLPCGGSQRGTLTVLYSTRGIPVAIEPGYPPVHRAANGLETRVIQNVLLVRDVLAYVQSTVPCDREERHEAHSVPSVTHFRLHLISGDKFNIFNHRHMCRNCQLPVCNTCSRSRKVRGIPCFPRDLRLGGREQIISVC